MHTRHSNARNLAHDFGVSLVHACVATLAALAGEMLAYVILILISGEDLATCALSNLA